MRSVLVTLLIFFAISTNCRASCYDDCETFDSLRDTILGPPFDYFGGISYIQHWATQLPPWKKFFDRTHPGVSFFFGRRISPTFGVEIGYEWTAHKAKSQFLRNGDTILNNFINVTGQKVTIRSKMRFKTGYIDMNVYVPVSCLFNFLDPCEILKPEFIFKLGVSSTKPKFHIHVRTEPDTVPETAALVPLHFHPIEQLQLVQGRTRALIRLGAGFQWFVLENVGLRIMYRFSNTQTLRMRIAANPHVRKFTQDDHSLAVSLYTTFPAF